MRSRDLINSDHTVYVVEDDEAALKSLIALLKVHGLKSVGFGSAEAFLEALEPSWRGCAIVDIRLPGKSGVELLIELKRISVSLPTIMVTAYGDIPLAVQAMKSGALDFIEKPYSDTDLLNAIEHACSITKHNSDHLALKKEAQQKLDALTVREYEVLELLAQGMTNKEIAIKLNRSPRTIEVHRNRIRDKTDAKSLSDLIRLIGRA